MHKSTAVFLSLTSLLLGVVLGFLLAPIKRGVEIHVQNDHVNPSCDLFSDYKNLKDDEYDEGASMPF